MHIYDDFTSSLAPHWTQVCTGGASVQISKSILRMGFASARHGQYTDAQIDDYTMLSRSNFLWEPPLRMTVRARSSHPAATPKKNKNELHGTAGFGFWNKPFSMQGDFFGLPEAIWFFHASPPSNMGLVPGIPGYGWKAQVIHTTPLRTISHIIPLAITTAYGRITGNTQPAGGWIQKLAGAQEALITNNMTNWHQYTLEWHRHESLFWVDNRLILRVPQAPIRPLGFVAWMDNEYAIATPRGELRFGKMDSGPQWLDLDSIKIDSL